MTRPRRHVIIKDNRFFKYLNFAYDDTRHATRILEYLGDSSALSIYSKTYAIVAANRLFRTESIRGCCVLYKDTLYLVANEAIFDKTSILYKDWWIMRADIACMYDKTTNRLFYHPLSAYCKALGIHSLSYISTNNWACLSQIWVRGPKDKVSDCAMSFCTHESDQTGHFCNFDLGRIVDQEYINQNPGASRFLSLCFGIRPIRPTKPFNIGYRVEQRDYQFVAIANYNQVCENQIEVEIFAFEEEKGFDSICQDAEGWVDLNFYNTVNCSSRVYLENGRAFLTLYMIQPNTRLGVCSTHPDMALLEFSTDF